MESSPVQQFDTNKNLPPVTLLIKESWKFFEHHWSILVSMALVPTLFSIAQYFLNLNIDPVSKVFSVIVGICGVVLSFGAGSALIYIVDRYHKQPSEILNVFQSYKVGFSFFWSLLLINIIYTPLLLVSPFVLFIIPFYLNSEVMVYVLPIIVLILMLFYFYVTFASYALVVDGKKGIEALVYSYRVVVNKWVSVFGRLFLLGCIIILTGLLIPLFATWIVGTFVDLTHSVMLRMVMSSLIFVGLGPFSVVFMYKLYEALKNSLNTTERVIFVRRWIIGFICIGPLGLIGFGQAIFVVSLALALLFNGTSSFNGI